MIEFLTVPTIAVLLIELVKAFIRKVIKKDDAYKFQKEFYLFALPLAEVVAPFILERLGYPDVAILTWSWTVVVDVFIRSLASIFVYEGAYKKLKATV